MKTKLQVLSLMLLATLALTAQNETPKLLTGVFPLEMDSLARHAKKTNVLLQAPTLLSNELYIENYTLDVDSIMQQQASISIKKNKQTTSEAQVSASTNNDDVVEIENTNDLEAILQNFQVENKRLSKEIDTLEVLLSKNKAIETRSDFYKKETEIKDKNKDKTPTNYSQTNIYNKKEKLEKSQIQQKISSLEEQEALQKRLDRIEEKINLLTIQMLASSITKSEKDSNQATTNTTTIVQTNNNDSLLQVLQSKLVDLQKQLSIEKQTDTLTTIVTQEKIVKQEVQIRPQYDMVHQVFFDYNASTIPFENIGHLANAFKNWKPEAIQLVVLTGYTDTKGSTDYNTLLAKRRVDFVKKELIQMGFKASQIVINYQGEDATAFTDAAARRVEVSLIAF